METAFESLLAWFDASHQITNFTYHSTWKPQEWQGGPIDADKRIRFTCPFRATFVRRARFCAYIAGRHNWEPTNGELGFDRDSEDYNAPDDDPGYWEPRP